MLRLREIRESKGITQTAAANDLKLTRQTYSHYENGRRDPDTNTLKAIAKYFNVSVDYLLGADTPSDKKIPKDLKKLLDEEEITLNGRMVSPEDKEKMLRIIEALYYDAKEENKRKS